MPAEEEAEILAEAEKVSEESKVHDPVRHPFKYPTDKVANISKKGEPGAEGYGEGTEGYP